MNYWLRVSALGFAIALGVAMYANAQSSAFGSSGGMSIGLGDDRYVNDDGADAITNDADEIALTLTGNATQTAEILVVERSDNSNVMSVNNDGDITVLDESLLKVAGEWGIEVDSGGTPSYIRFEETAGGQPEIMFGLTQAATDLSLSRDGWDSAVSVPTDFISRRDLFLIGAEAQVAGETTYIGISLETPAESDPLLVVAEDVGAPEAEDKKLVVYRSAVQIPRIEAAVPAEPFACATSGDPVGAMMYVDDTNDTAAAACCICIDTNDGTTLDWRRCDDNAAACPFF